MPRIPQSKADKIEHPQSRYATPDELIDDRDLSFAEKIDALNIWEQDARQMLTAEQRGHARQRRRHRPEQPSYARPSGAREA